MSERQALVALCRTLLDRGRGQAISNPFSVMSFSIMSRLIAGPTMFQAMFQAMFRAISVFRSAGAQFQPRDRCSSFAIGMPASCGNTVRPKSDSPQRVVNIPRHGREVKKRCALNQAAVRAKTNHP
jgi:hypothetical protein